MKNRSSMYVFWLVHRPNSLAFVEAFSKSNDKCFHWKTVNFFVLIFVDDSNGANQQVVVERRTNHTDNVNKKCSDKDKTNEEEFS